MPTFNKDYTEIGIVPISLLFFSITRIGTEVTEYDFKTQICFIDLNSQSPVVIAGQENPPEPEKPILFFRSGVASRRPVLQNRAYIRDDSRS